VTQQPQRRIVPDAVWRRIEMQAGQIFRQIRGQPFSYQVVGSAVRPSSTDRLISRTQFERALELVPLQNTVPVQHLMGPSYIYAILMDERIRAGDW
jgi:hypothetical protein